jgi:hypothetical protein
MSMFQQRHYQAVAEVVAGLDPKKADGSNPRLAAALAFAEKFGPDNGRFNLQKFMDACGCGHRGLQYEFANMDHSRVAVTDIEGGKMEVIPESGKAVPA